MREIDCIEAREKYGVYTLHHQMPNLELRFRLKKSDGTAYIRTEASTEGAWQESHYHERVRETYIVQKGWIAYAERSLDGQPKITIYPENELFTTQPGVIHNVFMPANSVIHTVKHGPCLSEDRKTDGTAGFDAFCMGLKSEAEIRSYARRTTASTKSRARYSEEYQHFDKLIWQVPAWATAIFALSFQSLGSDNIHNVADLTGVSTSHLAAFLLFGLSFMILCFAHVMYRFRVHQRSLKEYTGSSPFRSASTYTQLMIIAEAAFLFTLGLLATGVIPFWWCIAIGVVGFVTLTVSRELRLRSETDSISMSQ